jgi:hypothetical protein
MREYRTNKQPKRKVTLQFISIYKNSKQSANLLPFYDFSFLFDKFSSRVGPVEGRAADFERGFCGRGEGREAAGDDGEVEEYAAFGGPRELIFSDEWIGSFSFSFSFSESENATETGRDGEK